MQQRGQGRRRQPSVERNERYIQDRGQSNESGIVRSQIVAEPPDKGQENMMVVSFHIEFAQDPDSSCPYRRGDLLSRRVTSHNLSNFNVEQGGGVQ